MKGVSSILLISILLVQVVKSATGHFSFSSVLSLWSDTERATTTYVGLRRLSLVSPTIGDDDGGGGDVDAIDDGSSSTSSAPSTGHGGMAATATEDDDSVSTKTTKSTANDDAVSISNSTGSNSTTDDEYDDDDTTNNSTSPDDDMATEEPTLEENVEDIFSLLDDDTFNSTALKLLPPEKEQPHGWAGTVIGIFLTIAAVLFVATCVKQCQKRRTYSEVPTSLVV
jgi:hypothetical protein